MSLSAEFCLYMMKNYARNNFQSKTSIAMYYFYHLFLLQIKQIICTPNSMNFEPLFLKLLQFLDIQGSI